MPKNYELQETDLGIDLIVTNEWSSQAAAELVAGNADGLVLNYARGFRERSLDFLAGLPIRRLNVLARTIKNLDPIYSLAETLEDLELQTAPTEVHLDLLPRVVRLGATWSQVVDSISALPRLQSLFALSYSESSLDPLRFNRALRVIRMKDRPSVATLEGIEFFPDLEQLDLSLAPISSLAPLQSAAPTIGHLELESCKLIQTLDGVEHLRELRTLNLGDVGPITSLQPISELTNLERVYLWGSTVISDADLSPLANLPKLTTLRMTSRRPYHPSVAEIKAKIGDN